MVIAGTALYSLVPMTNRELLHLGSRGNRVARQAWQVFVQVLHSIVQASGQSRT
jgi:hypothetical protein